MPDDMPTIQRKILENTYLMATQSLILLAEGKEPSIGIKLEDIEFQRISNIASVKYPGPTSVLLSTLTYTFFQLKFSYNWTWEDIEFRPEVMQYIKQRPYNV
jgi:hypothetical protein